MGSRGYAVGRRAPADRPVRPLLVVDRAEGVELGLEPGEVGRRRLPPQPALEGLVEALDLALGLGVARRPVLLADAEPGEQVLEAVAAAGEARRVDRPVVGERGGGPAVGVAGRGERGDHVVAGDPPEGRAAEQVAGVVVEPAEQISTSLPSARRQWVKSDCQTSLGAAASNRIQELRGRLRGSGTTRPAAWRMRRMVEVDGTGRPSRPRCQAIVAGPASRPPAVSSVRRATIRSRTASAVPCGLVCGRRDRGSRSSRPPSRYRREEAVQVLAADAVLRRRGGDGQLR